MQIEPCRFCSSLAVRASFVRVSDEHQWHHVECGNCFAIGPHRTTSADAIAAWNQPYPLAGEGEIAHVIRRVEYILDMTATARERMHRRSHLTNHDLRVILASLQAGGQSERGLIVEWLREYACKFEDMDDTDLVDQVTDAVERGDFLQAASLKRNPASVETAAQDETSVEGGVAPSPPVVGYRKE